MKGEKDGSTAFMALLSSHAGKDKWEESQKDHMKLFTRSKWNDKAYTLEVVTIYHWSVHIQLQEAVDHVNFKLPTKHSRRVGYLIDNIENPDPDVCAGIGQILINTKNMRDNFELAVWKEEWKKNEQSDKGIGEDCLSGKGWLPWWYMVVHWWNNDKWSVG